MIGLERRCRAGPQTGEAHPPLWTCNERVTVTVRLSSAICFNDMDLPKAFPGPLRQSSQLSLACWAPFSLRLIVGYGFMEHGHAKIVRGPEHFAGILAAVGVPEPHLMSWMTILVELVGGLAVLLGVFVPVFAVPMAAILVVAATTVHLPNGFSSIKLLSVSPSGAYFGQPGYETDLLYLSCLAALVLGGSGALSIEPWLRGVRTGSRRME
jgi:putative oxidoreductase